MNQDIYSWVKTHQQLTQYLSKKQNAQQELIGLLKSIGISPFNDKSKEGSEYDIELSEIDPFTFFCYIYKYGATKRLKNLQIVAKKLDLHFPKGDGGIPSANAQKVWMFPWKFKRTNNEINRLWDFFFKAIENKITDEDFADVLTIRNVGKTKLTEALFNILPNKYLPINGPIRPYLKSALNIDSNFETYTEYLQILEKVKEKNDKPFYQISHESWEWGNRKANHWIFQCNPEHYDIENGLKNEVIDSWTVTAHKDKIKAGDKAIIWVTGENAGCYALAEVKSEPELRDGETIDESHWKIDKRSEFRTDISITHNLIDAPILKKEIEQIEALKNLKVGSQGTNFSATAAEYEAILEFIAPSKFEVVKNKFDKEGFDNYITYLRKVLDAINIDYNDQRITFSLRADRLSLTVGQRYCFSLFLNNTQGKFGVVSLGKLNESSETYKGNEKSFFTYFNNFESVIENFNEIIVAVKSELARTNKSGYRKNSNPEFEKYVFDKKANKKKYWLFAPGRGAEYWEEYYEQKIMGFGWDDIGDLNNFENKDEIKNELQKYSEKNQSSSAKMNWDFKENIQVGDIIFSRNGRSEIISYGIVTSDYYYDSSRENHQKLRNVDWKKNGSWDLKKSTSMNTLVQITDLTEINELKELLGIENSEMKSNKPQTNHPLNTIFYGPPGTGKTYNTIKRAAEIVEGRAIENYDEALKIYRANLHHQIEFITFHQNYSYEDFIQGLRPDVENTNLAFEQRDGIFKKIANKALENLKESLEEPEAISNKGKFIQALENLKDKIIESDEKVMINNTAYFTAVEDNAFRYSADNWTLNEKGFNGFRMKYSDLIRFWEENIQERKDIKTVENISGLAKQHASYFFKVYEIVKNLIQENSVIIENVELKNYVIIIDEINRANISRVFGELITLIEPDKRFGNKMGMEIILPSGDEFTIPNNLFIIGTMNTADKSIALLDIALRRRFTFEAMYPNTALAEFDKEILEKLNSEIVSRKGHDFQIGHSYFMGEENKDLVNRMNNKVIPLLLEYFMNDTEEVIDILQKANLEVEENSFPLRISVNG